MNHSSRPSETSPTNLRLKPSEVVSLLGGKKGLIELGRVAAKRLVQEQYSEPVANKIRELAVSAGFDSDRELADILGMSNAELSQFDKRVLNMPIDKVLELAARIGAPLHPVALDSVQSITLRSLVNEVCRVRAESLEESLSGRNLEKLDIAWLQRVGDALPLVNPDDILAKSEESLVASLGSVGSEVNSVASLLGVSTKTLLLIAADFELVREHVRPLMVAIIALALADVATACSGGQKPISPIKERLADELLELRSAWYAERATAIFNRITATAGDITRVSGTVDECRKAAALFRQAILLETPCAPDPYLGWAMGKLLEKLPKTELRQILNETLDIAAQNPDSPQPWVVCYQLYMNLGDISNERISRDNALARQKSF